MNDNLVIKILMCCHKSFGCVPPLCEAVQGGATLNAPIAGAAPDFGENGGISEKNREYCELTVQYHAWKNVAADYYGFCHYRRFFCFDESVKAPYITIGALSDAQKKRWLKTPEEIVRLIENYDIIVPRAEDMGMSAEDYYAASEFHFAEDMELFREILNEKFPHLRAAADEYLAQNKQYFCNMFIMRRELFSKYCEALFELLEAFDQRKRMHGDCRSDRTDGYLGERFAGIFFTYAKARGLRVKELARIDVGCSAKKRFIYTILPPESRRRAFVRKLVKRG